MARNSGLIFKAVRSPFFTASIIPVFFAAAYALWRDEVITWPLLALMFLSVLFLHAGTNTINDYYDFKKGVDRPDTFGSSRVLVDGLMAPEKILTISYIFFAAGTALGLIIVAWRGLPILALGITGLLAGYSYSAKPLGLKYSGLGDILVFIFMGPFLVFSAYYALTGIFSPQVIYVSVPIGFLVTSILHANNTRDMGSDKASRVKTLALMLGFSGSKAMYCFLVVAAYLSVVVMVALGSLPLFSLAVFLSSPLAVKNLKAILKAKEDDTQSMATMDIRSAQLHMVYGTLLIVSLILRRY
jgi:1,4-dihydroxy-2-naphthoate polyprenyltransferase